MRHSARAAACAAIVSFLTPLALADDPLPGFTLQDLPYPGRSATATLSDGRVVAFDGLKIDLYDPAGNLISSLGQLPAFAFPSFVLVDPSEGTIVVGESSNGFIYELGFTPGTPDPVAQLAFNYDAAFEDDDHLIVSAAATAFGTNDLVRVEVSSETTTLLAQVAGASGPVVIDGQGDLIYATVSAQFPAPPGSSAVLRWDAALLTGAVVLSEAHATVIEQGLDGAADLALDPFGDLYLAENNFGTGVNRIRRVAGNPRFGPVLIEGTPFRTMSNLEFEAGTGVAAFAGFQPPTGGTLRYNTTDFVSVFERKELVCLRPGASLSGPGTGGPGPFSLSVVGGPPGGIGIPLYGPSSQYSPNETALLLRVPLFLGLNLATVRRAPGVLLLDGTGAGQAPYVNPGGLVGLFAIQVVVFDAQGRLAGSSSATFL